MEKYQKIPYYNVHEQKSYMDFCITDVFLLFKQCIAKVQPATGK